MNRFKPRKQKTRLYDSSSDFWELSLNVNRDIWRKIPFREQGEIMDIANSLQCALEAACTASYEKLDYDYEVKLADERQTDSEETKPAKSATKD